MSMLLVPVGLCHDHSCIRIVTGFQDPRLALVVAVLATLVGVVVVALWAPGVRQADGGSTRQLRLLASLVMIILPYIPYSHVGAAPPLCSMYHGGTLAPSGPRSFTPIMGPLRVLCPVSTQ
jgi:hypothetical protein